MYTEIFENASLLFCCEGTRTQVFESRSLQ